MAAALEDEEWKAPVGAAVRPRPGDPSQAAALARTHPPAPLGLEQGQGRYGPGSGWGLRVPPPAPSPRPPPRRDGRKPPGHPAVHGAPGDPTTLRYAHVSDEMLARTGAAID